MDRLQNNQLAYNKIDEQLFKNFSIPLKLCNKASEQCVF